MQLLQGLHQVPNDAQADMSDAERPVVCPPFAPSFLACRAWPMGSLLSRLPATAEQQAWKAVATASSCSRWWWHSAAFSVPDWSG